MIQIIVCDYYQYVTSTYCRSGGYPVYHYMLLGWVKYLGVKSGDFTVLSTRPKGPTDTGKFNCLRRKFTTNDRTSHRHPFIGDWIIGNFYSFP